MFLGVSDGWRTRITCGNLNVVDVNDVRNVIQNSVTGTSPDESLLTEDLLNIRLLKSF